MANWAKLQEDLTGLADEDYVFIDSWDGFVGSFKSRYKDVRRFVYRIVSYRRQA